MEEWEQRRRDMGLVPGVPRKPSPSSPAPEYDPGVMDATSSDEDRMPFVLPVASADDPQGLKMASVAARKGGLRTPEELEEFHDAITKKGITKFNVLVDIAKATKADEY